MARGDGRTVIMERKRNEEGMDGECLCVRCWRGEVIIER